MEQLFTVEEAAEYLRVARQTLYKYMGRGVGGVKLSYTYVGGERRITRSAIEAFIKASTDRQVGDGGTIESEIDIPNHTAIGELAPV